MSSVITSGVAFVQFRQQPGAKCAILVVYLAQGVHVPRLLYGFPKTIVKTLTVLVHFLVHASQEAAFFRWIERSNISCERKKRGDDALSLNC